MEESMSIKTSILKAVSAGFLFLSFVSIFALYFLEYNNFKLHTESLVREQISLIVSSLDRFRDIQQIDFITKAIFDLQQVDGVALIDTNCATLKTQPLNFKSDWGCNKTFRDSNSLLQVVNTPLSNSPGFPKYIVVRLKEQSINLFNLRTFSMLIIAFASIFLTIVFITRRFKEVMLRPLDVLRTTVLQGGSLKPSDYNHDIPIELKPIYNGIYERDAIIQRSKTELLKQQEAVVTAKVSQQVAHDIRSPIMLLRDLLLNKAYNEKKFNDSLYITALTDLEALTGQLLESSSDFKKELDLSGLVQEIVEMKNISLRSNVKIKFRPTSEVFKIFANETKIKSVISNLLNNAVEAIDSNRNGEVSIELLRIDNFCRLLIRDSGKGILSENLEEIFKRGVSIGKAGGYGLGLSDAKEYINSIEGDIRISSQPREGTAVEIVIPIQRVNFIAHGKAPFTHVFIEDYKLTQLLWLEAAKQKNFNFVIFSNPKDFENNIDKINKTAKIYLDSFFPDFAERGENWSKKIFEMGFKNIWLCSTDSIDISERPWIKGTLSKEKPFSDNNYSANV